MLFLKVLGNCNVNLDYIYTSYHRGNSLPIMILQTDDVFVTENVLHQQWLPCTEQSGGLKNHHEQHSF